MRAIVLLSGGLDSTLAAKVIIDLGIEVEAVNFLTVFSTNTMKGETCLASIKAAETLGIPLRVFNVSTEFLDIVRHPKHGYGSNMNPCIDCRIFMLKKAKTYMEESGASFLITGEVLGQRPMSQRRDAMRLTEKEAELDGLILRPLSAKFLTATIPEKEGWVDREKLLNISGRSRKPQMELAASFGIKDYPCPAGGCLLTDPGFARRMRDLMKHDPDFSLNDVHLLKMGRHFRFSPALKLVVGRSEEENLKIQTFAHKEDIVLKLAHSPGPLSLLRGKASEDEIRRASGITLRYSKMKGAGETDVIYGKAEEGPSRVITVSPTPEVEIREWIIG
jgi:tRNA-uridine 2-sulfurtransferase